ncbi:hypothetical protein GR160_16940 [Flavobacterium sp. Sd200]|uniref:hypothetical protein n=1 Tax=Flavobacterium sp. Sd200 TaxID=2692211 RepID=UPI001371916D|nr:hypothetical protein [Flavobacterium sp. Sd200]MXN92915.1 hypothetical protein [Flavobacterium sp. Sd200]
MNFHFIATDSFDVNSLNDIEIFVEKYPDFQTISLENENELKLLLELMNINFSSFNALDIRDFEKYWDMSNYKFPELNYEQFDMFYQNWILKSKRINTMDEYGNLIFLQGLSSKWNKLRHRIIIKSA